MYNLMVYIYIYIYINNVFVEGWPPTLMLLASLLLVMPISKYNIFVEGWPALLANPDAVSLLAAACLNII